MDEEIMDELDRLVKRRLFPLDLRTCRCQPAKKIVGQGQPDPNPARRKDRQKTGLDIPT